MQLGQERGEFSSTLELGATTQFIHNALIGIRVQLKTTDDKEKLKAIRDMTLSVLKTFRKEVRNESSTNYQVFEGD